MGKKEAKREDRPETTPEPNPVTRLVAEDEIVRFFGTLDKRARVALDLRYQIAGMEGGDGKFGDRVDDASDVCPEDLRDEPELLRLLGIAEGMELHQRLQR